MANRLLESSCYSFFQELIVQEDAVFSNFIGGAIPFHVKNIGYEASEYVRAVWFYDFEFTISCVMILPSLEKELIIASVTIIYAKRSLTAARSSSFEKGFFKVCFTLEINETALR